MKKINIVIADDDINLLNSYKRNLEKAENINIVGMASNGSELYNILKSIKVDMVVTDNQMPGLSGIEVIRKLKNEDECIPKVIMVSGDNIFKECNELKIRLIMKPVDYTRLLSLINDISSDNENYNIVFKKENKKKKFFNIFRKK